MKTILEIPEIGDGDIEGTAINLKCTAGDRIERGQVLLEVETDKVVVEIPAEQSGIIDSILITEGDNVSKGTPFLQVMTSEAQAPQSAPKAQQESAAPLQPVVKEEVKTVTNEVLRPQDIIPAGPASRRLARQLGLDIADVQGSGPKGRISKSDVKSHVKQRIESQAPASGPTTPPLPDITEFGPCRREAMSRIQIATANKMVHSAQVIPHAWIQQKIDITDIEASRKRLKEGVKAKGGALTMTAFLCKAIGNALKQHPVINACIDGNNKELVYREYINIGIAADTPRGLLVPVIKNIEQLSIVDIAISLAELSNKARSGALTADSLKGGGFTISNLGGIGATNLNPVVNWPEVAILGVASAEWEPRLQNGEFAPRLMLPVTLGFDHRVVNGADGARFLQSIKEQLEDPACLALNS